MHKNNYSNHFNFQFLILSYLKMISINLSNSFIIVKTSVRPYIGIKKFWCLYSYLSVSCNSCHRYYTICLKFGTNVYMLCRISYIVFGMHCSNSTGIHKSISIYYGLWREIYIYLSVCYTIIVVNIIRFARNLAQMFICYVKYAV